MSFLNKPRTRRSIRAGLLAWLLPLAFVFMFIAWIVHDALLDRMARHFFDQRLREEATNLIEYVKSSSHDAGVECALEAPADEGHHRYALLTAGGQFTGDPRFRAFMQGHPPPVPGRFQDLRTGDQTFRVYHKAIQSQGPPQHLLVAESYGSLQSNAAEFHWWVGIFSAFLLILLVLLILLAVHFAMRPVNQLRDQLKSLQKGERERLDASVPTEFHELVTQINALLDSLGNRLRRTREAMANLSHSIKTPVSALYQWLDNQDGPLDDRTREHLRAQLQGLQRQIDTELRRQRFAGRAGGKPASPVTQTRELLWMLGRLYAPLRFEADFPAQLSPRWPMEEQDFNELVGNLADNGGKWARSEVRVSLKEAHELLEIMVEDDGPGIPLEDRRNLGQRGMRLDEQREGQGLGLAIVKELVDRYGGEFLLEASQKGGLLARIRIPRDAQGWTSRA